MDVEELLEGLGREGALLTAAVERADPSAPVPTCPEWAVRDLVHHTGGVHRWGHRVVSERSAEPLREDLEVVAGGWPDDQDLAPWIRAGHALLVDALRGVSDDDEIWAFLRGSPSGRAFWARRQLHETAIHRVDAELATGVLSEVPVAQAVDGIDELLTGFLPRRSTRLRPESPRTIGVQPTDADAGWVVSAGPEGATTERTPSVAAADVVVRGRAADLYLLLWNRRDLAGIEVTGDAGLLDIWRTSVIITWS